MQHMAHREHVRRPVGDAAVEQGTSQKDDPGDDGDPVQLAERASNDVSGEMRVGQNLKRRGREHECEEDQTADPDDEREQHQEAKEGHVGRIIVSGEVRKSSPQRTRRTQSNWQLADWQLATSYTGTGTFSMISFST